MNKISYIKRNRFVLVQVFIAVFIVLLFSFARFSSFPFRVNSLVSGIVYLLMVSFWAISINRRIIDKVIKRNVAYISILLIFLIVLRTLKWWIDWIPLVEQLLWYLYYIPILYIPLFLFIIALSLNKRMYRQYKFIVKYIYVLNAVLALFIVSNSMHQKVFKIIEWNMHSDVVEHQFFFYIIAIWLIIEFIVTMTLLLKNSKLPNMVNRAMAPNVVIVLYLVYNAFYLIDSSKYGAGFVEFTVAYCIASIAIIESLEITGLIPSNYKYLELFRNSEIPMMILDENYDVKLSSKIGTGLSKETYCKMSDGSVLDSGNTRINMKAIGGGYILWLDDIEKIKKRNDEIKKANEVLLLENELLEEEISLSKKELAIHKKEKIYQNIQAHILEKREEVDHLINDLAKDKKNKLMRICLIGSYIKRMSNMVLLDELYGFINAIELQNAILESLLNFKMKHEVSNSEGFIDFNMKSAIAKIIYQFFEDKLEYYFDIDCSLSIQCFYEDNCFNITWCFESSEVDRTNYDSLHNQLNNLGVYVKSKQSENMDSIYISVLRSDRHVL